MSNFEQDVNADVQPAWLFVYFRQIYGERVEIAPDGSTYTVPITDRPYRAESLHYAYSRDARVWTPLNGNFPVLENIAGKYKIRDPFIRRGPDGVYRMLATGGDNGREILYASSEDLINWTDQRTIPIMAAQPGAVSAWAPEFYYDEQKGNYLVFWSSSFGKEGWDHSRIWSARTTDFREFSDPSMLFDPGYTIIDATITESAGVYYMLYKDERFGHEHGEHRYMKVATASALGGPYTVVDDQPVTPTLTEGPSLIYLESSEEWQLSYDHCMANGYGASVSKDLLTWSEVTVCEFPADARHGTILKISGETLGTLLRAFPA